MEHKIRSGDHHLAAVLEEDTQRRQDDGEEDVYAVHRALVRHFLLLFPSAETPLERALRKIGRKNGADRKGTEEGEIQGIFAGESELELRDRGSFL